MTAVWDKKNRTVTLTDTSADEVLKVLLGLSDGSLEVVDLLNQILNNTEILMTEAEQLTAALAAIKTATDKQGVVLAAEGTTLQKISDEFDAFIAAASAGSPITPEMIATAQAAADAAAAVATSMQTQADFSTAIASKGATNPVPVPVPEPTPNPAG